MNRRKCFGTLYGFELKKILKNRIAVVAFIIFFIFGFIQGEFEVSGNIEPEILREYQQLDGRILDQELFSEWNEACDEYGNIIEGEDITYESVSPWIKEIAGYGVAIGDVNSDELYARRLEIIDEIYGDSYLDEGEIAYWNEQAESLEKPFTWYDSFIAFGIQSGLSNTMIIMLLVITASLSTIFSGEIQRRTDPIIRSSIYGDRETFYAKILAGSTFCVVSLILYIGVFLTYTFLKWGTSGLQAAEQVIYPFTQMDLTTGQTIIILGVLTILGSFMLTAVTMFFSMLLKNGVGTMALMIAGYFVMFALGNSIPLKLKTLSKVLSLFPAIQISPRIVYELRLFKIAGHYFRSYQVAGVSYVMIAVILTVIGYHIYRRYEG